MISVGNGKGRASVVMRKVGLIFGPFDECIFDGRLVVAIASSSRSIAVDVWVSPGGLSSGV